MPLILEKAEAFVAEFGVEIGAYELRMWLGSLKIVVYAPWDPPPNAKAPPDGG